jgi:hypothetical protein
MKRSAEAAGLPDNVRVELDKLTESMRELIERHLGARTARSVTEDLANAIRSGVVEQTDVVMEQLKDSMRAWSSLHTPIPDRDAIGAQLRDLPRLTLDWYRRHTRIRGLPRDITDLWLDDSNAKRLAKIHTAFKTSDPDSEVLAMLAFVATLVDSQTSENIRDLLFVAIVSAKTPLEPRTVDLWLGMRINQSEAYELLRYWLGPSIIPQSWARDVVKLRETMEPATSLEEIYKTYDESKLTRRMFPITSLGDLEFTRRVRDEIYFGVAQ